MCNFAQNLSIHRVQYITYNVRGLRDGKKRGAVFEWLRTQNVDMIFLQETHCESEKEGKKWGKEWGALSFWNNFSSRSRGVATLFNKNFNKNNVKCKLQENGRLQIFEIEDKLFTKPFLICNVWICLLLN